MSNWAQNNSNNYDKFLKICKDVLDGRAPVKRRYLRLNHSQFINKDISKATVNQTR